ncbi:MAG: hypothetical protein RL189_3002 [Pseudomonadota bacterium]
MRLCFGNSAFFASFLALILSGCVSVRPVWRKQEATQASSEDSKLNPTKKDPTSSPLGSVSKNETEGVCPEGAEFQKSPRSCVTRSGFILGPFPIELQELCRELFPSEAGTCVQKQDWPVEFLSKFAEVLKSQCPAGTVQMPTAGCLSSGVVYGPFTLAQVGACRRKLPSHVEYQCDQMAWSEELFMSLTEAASEEIKVVKVSPAAVEAQPNTTESKNDDGKSPTVPEPEKNKKTVPPAAEIKIPKPAKPSKEASERAVEAPTYCIYSWDERPGTADFTTQNKRLQSLRRSANYFVDRKEAESLLRSREFQNMDTCSRARFLKRCFQRVILESDSPAAQAFRAWSLGRVRPVEAHMAFVMKETRLGLWPDDCWNGRCKGVGIAKVASARTPAGRTVFETDPLWHGITHNIMTNLEFSLRNIADKTNGGATDLYALAFLYNGKARTQERYALDVDRYYKELLACNLDER